MNSSDRQSHIIQISLLKWISLIAKQRISSFQQLSQSHFYFDLLSKVPHFKFLKPLKDHLQDNRDNVSLVNKISNTRIIGQSIIRYYQTHLMKDVSNVKINYVQLCMGNTSQSIKLFSLLIGIFALNQGSQMSRKLEDCVQQLQLDDQYIVRALLENSKNIGEIVNGSIREDESILQKKILSKMQHYEDKIQSMELQIQNLKAELEQQKKMTSYHLNEIKQIKTQKSKLIQKAEVFELLNSRLQSENNSFILQNQNLVKKLQTQKRHYSIQIIKDNEIIHKYQKEWSSINQLKLKLSKIEEINEELKHEILQKNEFLKGQEKKFLLMKESYSDVKCNYKKLQERMNIVELEYQQYKLKNQAKNDSSSKNQRISSPYEYLISSGNNSQQLSSIKYRVKDKLESALKEQLSRYQMVNSHLINKVNLNNCHNNQDSDQKDIFIQSIQNNKGQILNSNNFNYSNCYYHSNLSNLMINEFGNKNLRDIQDQNQNISQFYDQNYEGIQNSQKKEQIEKYQKEKEQKSMKNEIKQQQNEENIDQSMIIDEKEQIQNRIFRSQQIKLIIQKLSKRAQQQQNVLISIIQQLFDKNLRISNQLNQYLKSSENIKLRKEKRIEIFKEKVKKITQIESLEQINMNFQTIKNINENDFKAKYFNEKQNLANISNVSSQRNKQNLSSKKYPYYQRP